MFKLDTNLASKVEKKIKNIAIVKRDIIVMCGCDSGCEGCNGCTGCATYGYYRDGWHDLYIERIINERKAS